MKKNKTFIIFNEEFWKNYIHYNDMKNVKNLVLIDKAIKLYKSIDKFSNFKNFELEKKVHETGLEAIKKGELKNESLLDFIENEDIYFKEKNLKIKMIEL